MGNSKIKIKVLIITKFEVVDEEGNFGAEAKRYYDTYLAGGESYDIKGCLSKLYVNNGIAMIVTGMGKVNAAVSLLSVLLDSRFDFSDAYFFSTGCAASASGYGVMGDVFLVTSTVDYDLGHHADARDLSSETEETWFHDAAFDDIAFKSLNTELCDKVYEIIKDIPLETTERTHELMARTFDNAEWAVRAPRVLRGTTVTSDNYWKGQHNHENALLMIKTYKLPDPYAVAEMEEQALATVLDRLGMLDRMIILRVSVNMDLFMNGDTPESMWSDDMVLSIVSDDNKESADIFSTSMQNNFKVGKVIIEAMLDGRL